MSSNPPSSTGESTANLPSSDPPRLIGEHRMPPVVIAFPDCFTRLDGKRKSTQPPSVLEKDFLLHDMRF